MNLKSLLQVFLEELFTLILRIMIPIFHNRLTKSIGFIYRRAYWKVKLNFLGADAFLYPNMIIHNSDKVSIGNHCAVAEFVHIWGGSGVTIGDNVMIASHVSITSSAHSPDENIMRNSLVTNSIEIEDNVWIGSHAVILPGVTIKNGSVIAAGAVVTTNVPQDVVVAGVPAKIIRYINRVVT